MAAAGAISVTSTRENGMTRYVLDWTSSAGGAVQEIPFDVRAGELVQVTFTPDSGGTQPTDLYDMTILDAAGADILGGAGANLGNAASTSVVPVVSTYFRRHLKAGALSLTISNAGNAKGGVVELLVR